MRLTTRPLPITATIDVPPSERIRSQFKVSEGRMKRALIDECQRIRATACVIEAGFREQDITLGGEPRASAKCRDSAVVVWVETGDGRNLMFPCSTYDDWWHNIYAIAKTMEALRAMKRWGATANERQYTGFLALPAPEDAVPQMDSRWDAARFVAKLLSQHGGKWDAERIASNEAYAEEACRAAMRVSHPKEETGSEELSAAVANARKLLEQGEERAA